MITTTVLLGILSVLATILRDVGFVVSFGGALLGSGIIYIFPALIFIKTIQKQKAAGLQVGVVNSTSTIVGLDYFHVLLGFMGMVKSSQWAFSIKL